VILQVEVGQVELQGLEELIAYREGHVTGVQGDVGAADVEDDASIPLTGDRARHGRRSGAGPEGDVAVVLERAGPRLRVGGALGAVDQVEEAAGFAADGGVRHATLDGGEA